MPFVHIWKHFKTITLHKLLVAKGCFRIGLYRQGLLHDMSKYSPTEFLVGVRYYQGTRSPNNAEREAKGYSASWLHHKGRNKHHYEYWFDYQPDQPGKLVAVPMPDRYIAEMIIDRIAASKVYEGKNYTDASAWNYYRLGRGKDDELLHPETRRKLEYFLRMLAREGEDKTFACIKRKLVHRRRSVRKGQAAMHLGGKARI